MNVLIFIGIAAVIAFIIYKIKKSLYNVKIDTVLFFTGAPGTGKTNEMINMALKKYRENKKIVKKENRKIKRNDKLFKRNEELKELPQIYSNLPIKVSLFKYSKQLEVGHLLLLKRIPHKSIVVITEIGEIASQYDWGNLNVQDNLDEFVRCFRHYTKGGYLLLDDQSSSNAVVSIRRRTGIVINMMHFSKIFIFYRVQMRDLIISEDSKGSYTESYSDSLRTRIGMFPLFYKRYDTYHLSERYNSVPRYDDQEWVRLKTNKMLSLPKALETRYGLEGRKYDTLTTKDDTNLI
jgi:hypothetical protein